MANILFLIDFEQGHVLSTMALSKTLAARGHSILYAGLADARETVTSQGFAFRPIMEDLFPAGSLTRIPEAPASSQRSSPRGRPRDDGSLFERHPAFARAEGACFSRCVNGTLFDPIVHDFQPHIAVALSYYYLEGLVIQLRYGLPVLSFTPHLRTASRREEVSSVIDGLMNSSVGLPEFLGLLRDCGVTVRSMNDIVGLLLQSPEFIALPRSFEDPRISQDSLVYYIGAGVDMRRREASRPWRELANGRALVYCSLGSQCALKREESAGLFRAVLQAFAMRPDWFLVLSTGGALGADALGPIPSNVRVFDWVPQMDVLTSASVMINHGGIGTVKECILSRVPMVVFPLMRDQFDCADRVTRLGLGVSSSMEDASPEVVQAIIARVLGSDEIRGNIDRMASAFLDEDSLSVAAAVVEEWAARRGGRRTSRLTVSVNQPD